MNETTIARPSPRGTLATAPRLLAIVLVLAGVAATFAWAGGWLSPSALTPGRFVDRFEQVNGVHLGFRRNHVKGVSVTGYFESNGNGVRLSRAAIFPPGRYEVTGRFSLGGGHPHAADAPHTVRGLGLQFTLPDGEYWRTAMVNLPVFPFRTAEAFFESLTALKPDPATGKPDPKLKQAFLERFPETATALKIIQEEPVSSGFHDSTFRSLNAFQFTSAQGELVPVRWLFKPIQPVEVSAANETPADKDYLFDELLYQLHREPLQWQLIVVVGQPGDPTDDATTAWPADRGQVDVGTLTIVRAESDDTSVAAGLNFDPLVLPVGIAPSNDPMLSARSAIYSRSFTRRAGEPKSPNEITPAAVAKGE